MPRRWAKLQRATATAAVVFSFLGVAAIGAGQHVAAHRAAVARSLPFIEDDYQRALAQARTRNLPLFVEAWALW